MLMEREEKMHKELDLIQSVITRMANNSFLLKGWLISLVAVVLALTRDTLASGDTLGLCLILLLPVVVFWYLDSFFLHREKCYRKLYEWIVENRAKSDDHWYSLDYTRFSNDVPNILRVMLSQTLLPFYGTTLLILLLFIARTIIT